MRFSNLHIFFWLKSVFCFVKATWRCRGKGGHGLCHSPSRGSRGSKSGRNSVTWFTDEPIQEGSPINSFIWKSLLISASSSPIFTFQNRGCYTKGITNRDWTFTSISQLKLNPNVTCSTKTACVTGPLCFDEGLVVSILHPYWMDRPVYLPARPPAGRRGLLFTSNSAEWLHQIVQRKKPVLKINLLTRGMW